MNITFGDALFGLLVLGEAIAFAITAYITYKVL